MRELLIVFVKNDATQLNTTQRWAATTKLSDGAAGATPTGHQGYLPPTSRSLSRARREEDGRGARRFGLL